ncbi:hypothetical protein BGP_3213 [Beggiatoa sp. PS]|nr:hypothetical protein BGP_3213 [Beggiatoa sp. PS]
MIIGARNTGKTTLLEKLVDAYYYIGTKVIILDSATEHVEKSLIKRLEKKYHIIEIGSPSEDNIYSEQDIVDVISAGTESIKHFAASLFPVDILTKTKYEKIIAFDVSYYLEEGYKTTSKIEKNRLRFLYKTLSSQILLGIIYSKTYIPLNLAVVMDEIELSIASTVALKMLSHIDYIYITDAVHSKESIKDVYERFNVITLSHVYN